MTIHIKVYANKYIWDNGDCSKTHILTKQGLIFQLKRMMSNSDVYKVILSLEKCGEQFLYETERSKYDK